jgi:hypothetical protein
MLQDCRELGFTFLISAQAEVPDEYNDLPRLDGRAEVQFTFRKGKDGEKFDLDGTLVDNIQVTMVLDGYTAPITAGNFLDLISKGFYKDKVITRADGFVVQTG